MEQNSSLSAFNLLVIDLSQAVIMVTVIPSLLQYWSSGCSVYDEIMMDANSKISIPLESAS